MKEFIKNDLFIHFDELQIYKNIYLENSLNKILYKIDTPFIMESQTKNWINEKMGKLNRKRKRKKKEEEEENNSTFIQSIYQKFMSNCSKDLFNLNISNIDIGNKEAKNFVKNSPKCEFECITESTSHEEFLTESLEENGNTRYKIFSNNHSSSSNSNLLTSIPIPSLLKENGLLCLWITNSEKIFNFALKLIKNWKLVLIAKWHWLKLCKSGEPICQFNPSHKVPFETILFACKPEFVEDFKLIRDDFCIIRYEFRIKKLNKNFLIIKFDVCKYLRTKFFCGFLKFLFFICFNRFRFLSTNICTHSPR
ncbi:unnamed protein product [Meloidogyne enterolobii]|uniref:Uncharacterized protein n=1 Tax=Meloidogyne enterolobii TaxID=390850 RepID=A0ACB1ASC0_MELEN